LTKLFNNESQPTGKKYSEPMSPNTQWHLHTGNLYLYWHWKSSALITQTGPPLQSSACTGRSAC
jgi:hypothetical protein